MYLSVSYCTWCLWCLVQYRFLHTIRTRAIFSHTVHNLLVYLLIHIIWYLVVNKVIHLQGHLINSYLPYMHTVTVNYITDHCISYIGLFSWWTLDTGIFFFLVRFNIPIRILEQKRSFKNIRQCLSVQFLPFPPPHISILIGHLIWLFGLGYTKHN